MISSWHFLIISYDFLLSSPVPLVPSSLRSSVTPYGPSSLHSSSERM